ncbi:FAD/NAD(P)-binding domain-containing protein [Hypoxylon fragiforme]|uniref:FAD/NAD(P)-binding domain-containing protein n=1 Tax=Hypoxylon fragiforme TaxID=63214 RepID=UPI0020C6EF00|nr:FAD/NAD(P)-binding domain-containing protein [Hypoxylon fragiforme]KAI2612767.1 FAD/NAD(P)-binding domain-containing protein [Hypoxylon fragiforme]
MATSTLQLSSTARASYHLLTQRSAASLNALGLGHLPYASRGLRLASTATSDGRKRERVVILGSGWAGYGFARSLDPDKYERIMISPRSYFVFTPLLAGTAVGTLEFRAVVEPVRRLSLDQFHQGWADDIDFAHKTIRVEANTSDDLASRTRLALTHHPDGKKGKGSMFDVEYDKLVIAIGSYSQTFGVEGVREHANFLRDVGDARKIRMKVLQNFEKAALPITKDEERKKLLHFAIVGGGPTGIEYAAELHDLIRDDLTKTYPSLMKFVSITVYDVAPKVLPMFDKKLADYAMDRFKRECINVKTEHHLTRLRPDEDCEGCFKLKIQEYGDEEVGAGIVVWSTGLMQNPLIQKLEEKAFKLSSSGSEMKLQKDAKTGGIVTDANLRVHMIPSTTTGEPVPNNGQKTSLLPDVYGIGDCTVISETSLPATAQVASQQAAHLAKRLNKGDVAQKPFRFRNLGTMTYLGNWTAIHQSSADELKGWMAWVLWRTAYLTRSMSIRNKVTVPFYWALSWIFGRDISRF